MSSRSSRRRGDHLRGVGGPSGAEVLRLSPQLCHVSTTPSSRTAVKPSSAPSETTETAKPGDSPCTPDETPLNSVTMRMTVIGTGYLGATHAACMAELGHDVLGVDVDQAKIEALAAGKMPFYEPHLAELISKHVSTGKLRFTTDYAEAAKFANVHFLAVGTPQKENSYAADMCYVHAVVDDLVPLLKGKHTIIGKSTVPVGTAESLKRRAKKLLKKHKRDDDTRVDVIWNPEFLREGHAVSDTITPDRIVIGASKKSKAEELARAIYAKPLESGSPLFVTDLPTAELVKVSANAFLATKISFINAMAEVCEAAGGDVTMLADAIGEDTRIGRKFLNAGLGFGGGCLPKDIRAFMSRAGELGVDQALTFLREVDAINMRRRNRMVEMARQMSGGSLAGVRVAVLGAAFKPESDDVRDSPALHVAGQCSLAGAEVRVYDPKAMENAAKVFPTLTYAENVVEAIRDADIVMVATEWKVFRDIDPKIARRLVSKQQLIDGRNCMPTKEWQKAGWDVKALGRSLD